MRVLLIGDGLKLTTGFAQVLGQCADALVRDGHDVWQLCCGDPPPTCDSAPYRARGVTPRFPLSDYLGMSVLGSVLDEAKPDVCLLVCDPGTARRFQGTIIGRGVPHVLYAPIEGAPIHPILAAAFRDATRAITVTAWGAERLAAQHDLYIPHVYHGADLSLFHPLDQHERKRLRREWGWDGKFITAYVARNNGRKGHDRLLKALRMLPAQHELYLHCAGFDNWALEGWDLEFLAQAFGVADRVMFPDSFTAGDQGTDHAEVARMLACADLYVHPSKAEGFGIPLVEAMSCGLPIVIPADRGNMEEVLGGTQLAKIEPADWDTWHTCAQLAVISPSMIAETIQYAEANPAICAALGEKARARALLPEFRWEHMTAAILPLLEEAAQAQRMPAMAC